MTANDVVSVPDLRGHFGKFGGRFVPEALMAALDELDEAFRKASVDPSFLKQLRDLQVNYTGRPSPITEAKRFAEHAGGATILLKREDLNHTGSHKINNVLGQGLLTQRMGKTRVIAETGAGQHGVATATVCALFDIPCVIYMGNKDIERQKPNVFRMKLLGAQVVPVKAGDGTLKDAMNEAMRDWVSNVDNTYYLIGTAAGPHPFPMMVRDFQSIIGKEAKQQILEAEGRLADMLVASIGGGSNALGLFSDFIDDKNVQMVAVEASGKGLDTEENAASIHNGSFGVLHGNASFYLQDEDGQIKNAHSISAGLDYPGIGPEHAYLNDIKRVKYESASDDDALNAFKLLARTEGILPALEPSHALAYVMKIAPSLPKEFIIIANLCGRGDKDIFTVANALGLDI